MMAAGFLPTISIKPTAHRQRGTTRRDHLDAKIFASSSAMTAADSEMMPALASIEQFERKQTGA
jgi:hypothetical protein